MGLHDEKDWLGWCIFLGEKIKRSVWACSYQPQGEDMTSDAGKT